VIFWTDYSAGRKTPLEITTLFAHTETRAEALVKRLLEENVTKGFERADGPRADAPAPAASDAEPGETAKPKKKAVKKKAD
jgi:ribosomal protein L12E/L44/L45/RPP1/RPP2